MKMYWPMTRTAPGFSLIEMAIVLTILGALLSGLLVALGQSTENSRRIEARNELRDFSEALYGFAQTVGRLPCPALNNTDGLKDPVGGGDCTAANGFLPNATLNLSGSINTDGLLLDPWGNPYRYSVAVRDASNSDRAFTSTTGLDTFFNNNELSSTTMLRVCDVSDCSGNILGDLVPAVVITMGDNWPSFTSTNEQMNGSGTTLGSYTVSNTTDFVSTDYSEVNFDDLIVWLSPHVLYSKMIAAGKLP